ncbi:MAG: S1 RNA-binding domain-containing protein [Candidatus ainarchaeum sp.]|nr:S1 RNA-binding domain-containing protein [Candidatus ainarchaeum sp.]
MNYPEINEIIIGKVTKITDFGVFIDLLEYDGCEGFVHISQVSSTWIKNIHNHVKPNQMRAAKVLKIDFEKNHIDLSLSRVTSQDEKRKISEYRLALRAQSLLGIIAQNLNISNEKAWEDIAEPILEKDDELYKGFINILRYGFETYNIDKKYHQILFDELSKNITIKNKFIYGIIKVHCLKEEGIEIIKKVFQKILKQYPNAQIYYSGPGVYDLKVIGKDFKLAAKSFENISKDLSKEFKNSSNLEIIKKDDTKK